jgi:protein-disulfide isomerase
MKQLWKAGAAALALTLAACGGSGGNNAGSTAPTNNAPTSNGTTAQQGSDLPQIAAPNNGDWTQTIAETERGFRMGNPDAPVKLVEYASITCPHCGQFATEGGSEGIQRYVRSGQVSWEYRPYMIFPTDPGLFALMRCQGAGSYFQLMEQLYTDQRNWAVRAQTYIDSNQAQLQGMELGARSRAMVTGAGLDAFFRQRGMPQSRIESCLADARNLQRVADDTQHASTEDNVSGTPTFFINGEATPPNTGFWSQLEPLLRARISG